MSRAESLTVESVKRELQRLRRGQGLGHPAAVLHLTPRLRAHLAGDDRSLGTADEVLVVMASLRQAIERLDQHQRVFAEVDFNLDAEHSYPTLSGRQESLACQRACASKTVRRQADKMLYSLAFNLVAGDIAAAGSRDHQPGGPPPTRTLTMQKDAGAPGVAWYDVLRSFWRLYRHARVDIVCSEIPEDERPYFASPLDRNYLRYSKFADLDSLIYVRTRLTQIGPDAHVRDFAPSEYHDSDTDSLVVIGGPPWNAKYREFVPQLPFYFDPHPLGEDDPLVVPLMDDLTMGPRWTGHDELLEDVVVFTRLSLVQGPTVFLLGGCLTLGVLGAARCFLQGDRGADNARYVTELVGDADVVVVTEARRMGGIADVADLATVEPLLVLARDNNEPFSVVVDNTTRFVGI